MKDNSMQNLTMQGLRALLFCLLCAGCTMAGHPMDKQFEDLGKRYMETFPVHAPVAATWWGDHRFDGKLDEVSAEARAGKAAFYRFFLNELKSIEPTQLSRANQVDRRLLEQELEGDLWRLEELQEWAWNPLTYTRLAGGAVYSLVARDFAPLPERLVNLAARLEQFPRLFKQIRATIDPKRVPKTHAETAVKQNRGVISVMDTVVAPHLAELPAADRKRLSDAMAAARSAVEEHQTWLEKELTPHADAAFRLGAERYDKKLAFTLKTDLTRKEIRERAESELKRTREEMYELAKEVYKKAYPYTEFPAKPTRAFRQAVIRAALEMAYQDAPGRDEIVAVARKSLATATAFVREKEIVTVPPDPLEIIVMPEFRRGVALAYCDSPGPLDVGQKTFYAVAPPPADWTEEQVQSLLREYNRRSIHNLTIHEAMPGHFLQLAHANRYPAKLRAVLSSGVFIEGWAVYTERVMADAGYMDSDPLMRLIMLKWYLRAVANAILDQAIHTEGMTREAAMRIMIEDTFQEEREAAGKWVRAQLTSTQLATYFVGYLEHADLRREVEASWGDSFSLKRYHDRLLSFGSPPTQFVRALLLEKPLPE